MCHLASLPQIVACSENVEGVVTCTISIHSVADGEPSNDNRQDSALSKVVIAEK